ncbi:MAG: nucleoside triphosphate pyrophosphohydrolase [Saprospiraceae bacterium]|uniref:Nucleoside triphosphate pyrophosphohydrolase n=1 Tax=Candidatus Opimibacter skivensis TaxID=2982028 RepID=A0A9D7SWS4_9BACT|nr:nucleoside triphosphate pyrophosphohydrolase [Candidatus Opimibacter skivensis]
MDDERLKAFERLLDIMDDLREKCPWDMKQDIHSLRILTIEETYELADAIIKEDWEGIGEELGDLLLHIVFYARIGKEKSQFDITSVINTVCDKLIRRHPHIYGDTVVIGEEDVKRNWETIKKNEGKKSVLSGVPDSLPAMIKAFRMQDKTRQVGFEWENDQQVWDKVEEEITEFKEASVAGAGKSELEDEFGDILFSLINYARYKGIDPETSLEKVNQKFKRRFEYIEAHATKALTDMTLGEMDGLWNEAKAKERVKK